MCAPRLNSIAPNSSQNQPEITPNGTPNQHPIDPNVAMAADVAVATAMVVAVSVRLWLWIWPLYFVCHSLSGAVVLAICSDTQ
jgi:hypothetical protein